MKEKKEKQKVQIVFKNGVMEHIYKEGCKTLDNPRKEVVEMKRATEVEPDPENPGFWYIDLGKSGGPIIRGFKDRSEAIEGEIKWLNENYYTLNKKG